jgi:hypothetical protein
MFQKKLIGKNIEGIRDILYYFGRREIFAVFNGIEVIG